MEWNELSGKGSGGSVCMFTRDNVDNKHYFSLFLLLTSSFYDIFKVFEVDSYLMYAHKQDVIRGSNKDQLLTFWPLNLFY